MELRQLKYFLAVADARSFVRAANDLYLSRQAVSKSISQLEEELNTPLFMRDSNGAFLTPAGVFFYERARSTVLELEQLQAEMQQFGTQFRQSIRMVFSVGTLQQFEDALQAYLRLQNNLVVEYRECTAEDCTRLLLERKADVAITSGVEEDPRLSTWLLCQDDYGVLLEEHFQGQLSEMVTLGDLSRLPLACLRDGRTEQFCSTFGLTPQYIGFDLARLLSIAQEGRCAVVLPKCLVPTHLSGMRWCPLSAPARWQIHRVCLSSLDSNSLFHTALDELTQKVFTDLSKR